VSTKQPSVFLCHAAADNPLAARVASDLIAAGIETFYSEWSIPDGGSIRQLIDTGLSECSHFVVLLTEASIQRPWVNTEIDAAFMRKVQGQCEFIPLRHSLSAAELPPLLAALRSPEISEASYSRDLQRLVGTVYGITQKPPLGPRPIFTAPPAKRAGRLSLAAQQIASEIVRNSETGRAGQEEFEVGELLSATGLSDEDFEVAVDELESLHLVSPVRGSGYPRFGYLALEATERTFVALDAIFMDWNPEQDGVRLAVELLNSGRDYLSSHDAAETLGWAPRRLNPALAFLIRQRAVMTSRSIDRDFVTPDIYKNSKTLRFVRERS
jgi:hypothetical protein